MLGLNVQTRGWGWGGGGALREVFQEAVSLSWVLIREWALASKRRGLSVFQAEGTWGPGSVSEKVRAMTRERSWSPASRSPATAVSVSRRKLRLPGHWGSGSWIERHDSRILGFTRVRKGDSPRWNRCSWGASNGMILEGFLSSSKESTIGRRTEKLVQRVQRKRVKGSSTSAEDSSWAPGPVNCKATFPGPRTNSRREVHSLGHSPRTAATWWFLQVTTASAVPSSTRSLMLAWLTNVWVGQAGL